MRISLALALAGLLFIAACHPTPDEETPSQDNDTNVVDETPETVPALNQARANVSLPENRAQPPEFSDEQQIQDDAAASGMTSRLPDSGEASPAPDSAAADAQHGLGNPPASR